MNKQEFWNQMSILEKNYNKKIDKETIVQWWEEFKNFDIDTYSKIINQTINQNKYMPTIGEFKEKIKNNTKNLKYINLNSSYWYVNLRKMCDELGKPYFDIITGKPLSPFVVGGNK